MGGGGGSLLERGNKPVKDGGSMYKWWVLPLFLLRYSSIIFTLCVCVCVSVRVRGGGESNVPFMTFRILAMQDSDPSFYCTKA